MSMENERLGILVDKMHERDVALALVSQLRTENTRQILAHTEEVTKLNAKVTEKEREIARLEKLLPPTEAEKDDTPPRGGKRR